MKKKIEKPGEVKHPYFMTSKNGRVLYESGALLKKSKVSEWITFDFGSGEIGIVGGMFIMSSNEPPKLELEYFDGTKKTFYGKEDK